MEITIPALPFAPLFILYAQEDNGYEDCDVLLQYKGYIVDRCLPSSMFSLRLNQDF